MSFSSSSSSSSTTFASDPRELATHLEGVGQPTPSKRSKYHQLIHLPMQQSMSELQQLQQHHQVTSSSLPASPLPSQRFIGQPGSGSGSSSTINSHAPAHSSATFNHSSDRPRLPSSSHDPLAQIAKKRMRSEDVVEGMLNELHVADEEMSNQHQHQHQYQRSQQQQPQMHQPHQHHHQQQQQQPRQHYTTQYRAQVLQQQQHPNISMSPSLTPSPSPPSATSASISAQFSSTPSPISVGVDLSPMISPNPPGIASTSTPSSSSNGGSGIDGAMSLSQIQSLAQLQNPLFGPVSNGLHVISARPPNPLDEPSILVEPIVLTHLQHHLQALTASASPTTPLFGLSVETLVLMILWKMDFTSLPSGGPLTQAQFLEGLKSIRCESNDHLTLLLQQILHEFAQPPPGANTTPANSMPSSSVNSPTAAHGSSSATSFSNVTPSQQRHSHSFKSFYHQCFYIIRKLTSPPFVKKSNLDYPTARFYLAKLLAERFPIHMHPFLGYLDYRAERAHQAQNNSGSGSDSNHSGGASSRYPQPTLLLDPPLRINLDQWNCILEWCLTIHPYTLAGYEVEGPWPLLIDDYVKFITGRTGMRLHQTQQQQQQQQVSTPNSSVSSLATSPLASQSSSRMSPALRQHSRLLGSHGGGHLILPLDSDIDESPIQSSHVQQQHQHQQQLLLNASSSIQHSHEPHQPQLHQLRGFHSAPSIFSSSSPPFGASPSHTLQSTSSQQQLQHPSPHHQHQQPLPPHPMNTASFSPFTNAMPIASASGKPGIVSRSPSNDTMMGEE